MFVCSTTGDGDPPDTASKFWRRLKKRSLQPGEHLKGTRYTFLGKYDAIFMVRESTKLN